MGVLLHRARYHHVRPPTPRWRRCRAGDRRCGPMVSDSGVTDPQQLQRLLGAPELGWLIDRIRIRLERGEPVDGTVTLVGATADQRRAASRLLGRATGRGTSLSIPLPEGTPPCAGPGSHPGCARRW